MTDPFHCAACRFDLAEYRATLAVRAVAEQGAIALKCPACGAAMMLEFAKLGLASTKISGVDKLVRIVDADAAPSSTLPVGRLTLDLGDALKPVSVKDLCFPAVPLLQLKRDPSVSAPRSVVPDVPVRPEYMALVDWTWENKQPLPGYQGGSSCAYLIKFHGRAKADSVNLPVLGLDAKKPAGVSNSITGTSLELWPNLPYRDWKRYFVRLISTPETVDALKGSHRTLTGFYGTDGGPRALEPRGRGQLGMSPERPTWLGLKIDADGAPIAGGAWRVRPATEAYPHVPSLRLGIDFGTSNTCIAYESPEAGSSELKVATIPFADLTLRVVDGEPPPATLEAPLFWFPTRGYGPGKNILPTELAFYQKRETLQPDVIARMEPMVDFTLPSPGHQITFTEQDHVLAEFKWVGGELGESARLLQHKYLELTLLFALAQLAARKVLPGGATPIALNFSFPLAFDADARRGLHDVFARVAKALGQATGFSETKLEIDDVERLVNESIAAGRAAGGYGTVQDALFIDIGGGSADIALAQLDHDGPAGGSGAKAPAWVTITSFKYAGTGFIAQLTKSHCLSKSCDLPTLRRKIRELGSVTPLLRDSTVIKPEMQAPIENKTWRFYHHLLEYVARLLAARVITGAYRGALRAGPRDKHLVGMYTLGNGWGFGPWVSEDFSVTFASRLERRVKAIIDHYRKLPKESLPPILQGEHPYSVPFSVAHQPLTNADLRTVAPKEAVAFGLLAPIKDGREPQSPFGRESSVVGVDFAVTDRQFRAPWYLPVASKLKDPPDGFDGCKGGGILDLPSEGSLPWPPEHFSVPSGEIMKHVMPKVGEDCLPRAGSTWLHRSPYEVLLERFWLPTLHQAY